MTQLIVLGMHRSGTSALTRVINMMGAFFAHESFALPSNSANPKGFWERADVMYANNAIFFRQSCEWNKLAKWCFNQKTSDGEHKIRQIVVHLNQHQPWVIKDPRMCLTLMHWLPFLNTPVAVVMSRNPKEVAMSLNMRDTMRIEHGLALWEYHAVGIIKNAAQLPKVFVRHEELMADPVNTTANLYDDLCSRNVEGITLPSREQILEFIDPSLYRAKDDGSRTLTPHQQWLYAMLRGEEEFDTSVEVSEESKHIMLSK
jgi:hypothetical protein